MELPNTPLTTPNQPRPAEGMTGGMRLDRATWPEIEAYLSRSSAIIIPSGSTEQHGPIGLIGTDSICSERIAERAAELADALVAPTLAYTPAPFNLAFPGTISVSPDTFRELAAAVCRSLSGQGFTKFYFLNGHGANLDPLKRVAEEFTQGEIRVRSWWDFPEVEDLRRHNFGDWEGMHATPSEVSITQAVDRSIRSPLADAPPRRLTPGRMRACAGDRHGPPDSHRAEFPDGRVGSHSALATPEIGRELLTAAAGAVARDYRHFVGRP